MHKPHIILDQTYQKVTRTRNIAFNVSKKCFDKEEMRYDEAETVEDAIKSAAEMIRKYQID